MVEMACGEVSKGSDPSRLSPACWRAGPGPQSARAPPALGRLRAVSKQRKRAPNADSSIMSPVRVHIDVVRRSSFKSQAALPQSSPRADPSPRRAKRSHRGRAARVAGAPWFASPRSGPRPRGWPARPSGPALPWGSRRPSSSRSFCSGGARSLECPLRLPPLHLISACRSRARPRAPHLPGRSASGTPWRSTCSSVRPCCATSRCPLLPWAALCPAWPSGS